MLKKQAKTGTHYLAYILLGFLFFNLIWYACAELLQLKALPTPLNVYLDYSRALDNDILDHTWASLQRIFTGMLIAGVIALVVGVELGLNKKLNKLFGPLLYFTYPIPKLALLPIVMILFGIGEASKIIIIVLIIVFQLIISVRDSVVNVHRENYDVLTSLKATKYQKMRHITVPAILPDVFSSLRVALGIAMSALFFTETFGTDKGLGFYITDSWMRIDYIQMYFGIIVLSLTGFVLFLLLDLLDTSICAWKRK